MNTRQFKVNAASRYARENMDILVREIMMLEGVDCAYTGRCQ